MDESRPVQIRRYNRSNVLLTASLEFPGASLPVVLKNLSQEGALIHGEDLPEEGSRVLFHRQGLSVPSRVAWLDGDHAGLQFDVPLFPRELLRHVPPAQHRSPPVMTKWRPGFGSRPLSEGERLLVERWATEGSNKLGD